MAVGAEAGVVGVPVTMACCVRWGVGCAEPAEGVGGPVFGVTVAVVVVGAMLIGGAAPTAVEDGAPLAAVVVGAVAGVAAGAVG